jgi:hypothetical protein
MFPSPGIQEKLLFPKAEKGTIQKENLAFFGIL